MRRNVKLFLWVSIILLVMIGIMTLYAGEKSNEQVTLRFSWWGGDARHKATLEAIDLYMKLNPNIKILSEYGGAQGYLEKKKIELASNTAPDIMQIDQTWLQELISRGDFFVDLSKRGEVNVKAFDQGFLGDFCTYNGKLVGLPTGLNAQLLLVNKTAADKMGVDISKLGDWDTMLAEGKKLHEKNKGYYLFLHDTESFAGEVLMAMVKQMTGKKGFNDDYTLNFGKPELVRMYTWLSDAVKYGVLEPPGDAALYTFKGEQNPKWINQQIICLVDWASNYTRYLLKDAEFILMLPPILKNAKTGASQMRPSQELCANIKSRNISESVKFIDWFLNNKDAAVILGDVRSIPASSIARDAAAKEGKINKMTSDAVGAATKSRIVLESAIGYNRQIVQIGLDIGMKVEFGELTPEEAAVENLKLTEEKVAELKAEEQE
ncbi:MAG: extracellular solute-binding protein [Spirochaetales bacterium]|nr:extracellular solute-binding protein [Spirochaetales bacterium]